MEMPIVVNIMQEDRIQPEKESTSSNLYGPPERIANLSSEEKTARATHAVISRDTVPQVKDQRGYVMSFDLESGHPVRIYRDRHREL